MNSVVTIEIAERVMKVELYSKVASDIVRSLLSLVKKGFYDGTIFHHAIPGFVVQGGGPEGTGVGGPDHHVYGESAKNGSKNDLKHIRGVISMARVSHPGNAGSQSFLMTSDAPYLDGNYVTFGKTIEGLEEIDRTMGAPHDAKDRPREDQVMKKVTAETFGIEYEEPETLPL